MTTNDRTVNPEVRIDEIEEIEDEFEQAKALASFAPQMHEHMFPRAIRIIKNTRPSRERLDVMTGIAPNLPPDLLFELFNYLTETNDEHALLELFPFFLRALPEFPEELRLRLMDQALSAA